MTATASHSIHLRSSGKPITIVRADGIGRKVRGVIRPTFSRRLGGVIADLLALLAIVFSFPAALLLVGVPIALTIALLLWLGRVALSVL